jgi:hypothetical protein
MKAPYFEREFIYVNIAIFKKVSRLACLLLVEGEINVRMKAKAGMDFHMVGIKQSHYRP